MQRAVTGMGTSLSFIGSHQTTSCRTPNVSESAPSHSSAYVRFQAAHGRACSFLYGALFVLCLIAGTFRWLLGVTVESYVSADVLIPLLAIGLVSFLIPRLAFHLVRYINADAHQAETIGGTYAEFRARAKETS